MKVMSPILDTTHNPLQTHCFLQDLLQTLLQTLLSYRDVRS